MAFNVQFYSFGKEVNSTERPSGNGTVISCIANTGVDILNPSVSLNRGLGGANSPVNFNYCYIPDFNRYYFIENWSWGDGLWTARCSVDVLASYKPQIGAMRAYVVRSAEEYDGTIADALYPAKNSYSYNATVNTGSKHWYHNLGAGIFVVGIIGNGITTYYAMTKANLDMFIEKLLDDTYARSVLGVLGIDAYPEAKAILDPLQYVPTVTFFPFVPDVFIPVTRSIPVGYGNVPAISCQLVGGESGQMAEVLEHVFAFENYPNHPLAFTRGRYLNYAPWTRRYLFIPPFGMMELDCTELGDNFTAQVQVDLITGAARLLIAGQPNILMTELKTQMGVQIQLGQVIAKGMGALTIVQKTANLISQTMGGATGGGGTGGMVGNIMGLEGASKTQAVYQGAWLGSAASFVSGTAGFIRDAIDSKIPVHYSTGSMGGIMDLYGTPYVFSVFAYPVDESRNTRGRPLCAERVLSTLAKNNFSGYILVADPDVSGVVASAVERDAIAAFLSGGFYYA